MKMRIKGKVHPFTASSSSPSPNAADSLSVLKLLPAAILTLVSLLSLEDREVLAYMISRSLKSTNPSFFPATNDEKKNSSKLKQCGVGGHNAPALFDCDCFHCYTSFWFRWDSSPNRELIHQAIEAIDDHLNTGEHFKNPRTRRRDKLGRRKTANALESPPTESARNEEVADSAAAEVDGVVEREEDSAVVVRTTQHRGLARKMLPDLMGIFHSRYWGLWSPNV